MFDILNCRWIISAPLLLLMMMPALRTLCSALQCLVDRLLFASFLRVSESFAYVFCFVVSYAILYVYVYVSYMSACLCMAVCVCVCIKCIFMFKRRDISESASPKRRDSVSVGNLSISEHFAPAVENNCGNCEV